MVCGHEALLVLDINVICGYEGMSVRLAGRLGVTVAGPGGERHVSQRHAVAGEPRSGL